jgi:hypothetical protein
VKRKIAFSTLMISSFALARAGAQGSDSSWIIRGGTYAGQAVSIDRSLAAKKSSRFWRVSSVRGDKRIVGWNPSTLPAHVAFHNSRITAADSIAFWSTLRRMEEDMGMHLFEPASLATEPDDATVIVVDLKAMAGDEGVTYITWSTNSSPYDARVYLRSTSSLHDARVVTHEMMHALGFGHTTSWTSIMNAGPSGPDRLSVEDVAYAQAAFESRASNERDDMWERLALAVSRESPAPAPLCAESDVDLLDAGVATIISKGAVQSGRARLPIEDPRRLSSCFQ